MKPDLDPDLDRLRQAFAQPDDAPNPATCPTDAEIWDAAGSTLEPDRLREIVDHTAACAACAESWRIALELQRRAAAATAGAAAAAGDTAVAREADIPANRFAGTPASRPARAWAYGTAAAAAVILAAAFALHYAGPTVTSRPAPEPATATERGGGIVAGDPAPVRWLVDAGAVLPRHGARLRWSGPPDALYDLTVESLDQGGAEAGATPGAAGSVESGAEPAAGPVAVARGIEATSYTLPESSLLRSPAHTRLHALLTAHLVDGRSITLARDFRLP